MFRDRGIDILGPYMPDPRDVSPAPRRPHKRIVGTYRLTREQWSDVVEIEEPTGDTYELVYFDCEKYLKSILKLSEIQINTILDRLWNFYSIEVDLEAGVNEIRIRTFDRGFEKLIGEQ